MNKSQLLEQIKLKRSFLCIGLDTDINQLPKVMLKEEDPIFSFNKAIIEATHQHAVAYKPNTAFYEAEGSKGWHSLEKTIHYLHTQHPEIFTIADAKRGDIGNTAERYAEAFFKKMAFNAVTVAPYMGFDSVKPFLRYHDKWVVLLALTSNSSSSDFQYLETRGKRLFEYLIEKALKWGSDENLMFVVGATHPEELTIIRQLVPNHFLLVPGVGAQGGNLEKVVQYGITPNCGLLINASRSILYASSDDNFSKAATYEAESIHSQMDSLLNQYSII